MARKKKKQQESQLDENLMDVAAQIDSVDAVEETSEESFEGVEDSVEDSMEDFMEDSMEDSGEDTVMEDPSDEMDAEDETYGAEEELVTSVPDETYAEAEDATDDVSDETVSTYDEDVVSDAYADSEESESEESYEASYEYEADDGEFYYEDESYEEPAAGDVVLPSKKRIRLFNFSRKLMLMCLVPMIVVSVAIIYISSNALTSKVEGQMKESLRIVTCSLDEMYNSLYTGDYSLDRTGRLSKGETLISKDTDLIDGLKEKTGFESSMIYEGMRRITTVKREAGGRIQGTDIDKKIYKQIQKGKSVFRTDVVINDITYYAYYQPLYNSDGTVCGAVGSATPAAEVTKMMKKAQHQVRNTSIIIIIISMILILLLSSRMARSMRKTKNYLTTIADGDLVSEADPKLLYRNDELGDIYSTSVRVQQELRKIVTNIKESVDELTTSADDLTGMAQGTRLTVDEVYASVEVVSQSANTQAEHTSTAANNVSRIGDQIEVIAGEVDSLTVEAGKMAEAEKESEVIIHELNASNEDTIASITSVAEQINVTNASIRKIRKAATMIQEISEETDLLSLNASIEAARAGEAGKGFAVVAEQICKLAEQSNQAAEQIEIIINGVTEESQKMVEIMDVVKANVDEQQEKLEETKSKFNAVAVGVDASRNNIEGIRKQMEALGESSDAIMGVVENLADISEKNAESTEDTMASALDMTSTMEELEVASSRLRELSTRLDESLGIFKM